jgi:hypothetical protein
MFFKKRFFLLTGIIFIIVIFSVISIRGNRLSLPALIPGAYIQDGSDDLDAGFFSVPFVFDWNGDSKKDLLVGLTTSLTTGGKGKIRFYQNLGDDNIPHFEGASFIQACNNTCSLDVEAAF